MPAASVRRPIRFPPSNSNAALSVKHPRSHLTSPPPKNSPQPGRKFPGYKKTSNGSAALSVKHPRSHLTSPPPKNSPQPGRKFPGYKKTSNGSAALSVKHPRSHLTSPPPKNSPRPDRKFPGYKKLSPRGEFSDKKKIRFQRLLPLSLTIPAGSELVCGLRTRRTFAGLGSRAFSTRSSPPHS